MIIIGGGIFVDHKEEDDHHEGSEHTHHNNGHVGGDIRGNRNRCRKLGESIHGEGDDVEAGGKNHPNTHAHNEGPHAAHCLSTRARCKSTHAHGLDTLVCDRRGRCEDRHKEKNG